MARREFWKITEPKELVKILTENLIICEKIDCPFPCPHAYPHRFEFGNIATDRDCKVHDCNGYKCISVEELRKRVGI